MEIDPYETLRTTAERALLDRLKTDSNRFSLLLSLEDRLLNDPVNHVYSSIHIRRKLNGGDDDDNGDGDDGGDGDRSLLSARYIRTQHLEDHYLWCDLFTYNRFLRARRWNLDAAWEFLSQWIAWRQEKRPFTVHSQTVQNEICMEGAYWLNMKPIGSPMVELLHHHLDEDEVQTRQSLIGNIYPTIVVKLYNHLVSERDVEGCLRYTLFMAEQGLSLMRDERPEHIDQYCILLDVSQFSMRKNMDLPIIRQFLETASMYPETLHTVFICRPGFVFRNALHILRKLLDKDTADKIVIINDLEELKQYYDEDVLPKEFAGTSDQEFDAKAIIALGRADRKNGEPQSSYEAETPAQ